MFIFDPLYMLFTAPAVVFSLWAQWKVHSTFKHYSNQGVRTGMTGAQAAAAVLRSGGVQGVTIERHQGFLSDHYDPRAKALRLSPDVYEGRSVSSIAVAAHEAGHAIQDAVGYTPLVLRSNLVPLCNIGNHVWFLPFLIGAALQSMPFGPILMWTGILMFATVVLFQLVTLPTEFNASNRAKAVLAGSGIVTTQEEAEGVKKVLDAAAMTYVAAAAAAILQLVYLIFRAQSRRD